MAISLRAASTGPNSNASSTTISLPSGTTTNDVTFIAFVQAPASGYVDTAAPTFTPPSGWTVAVSTTNLIVVWRAWQSGDPSSVTCSSSASNWWESAAISYIGVDTTAPVDASNYAVWCDKVSTQAIQPLRIRAPSVNPQYMGSQLLCVFGIPNSSGHSISPLPSGLTSRATTGAGPNLLLADKALTDGTPTGNFDSVQTSGVGNGTGLPGAAIAIKASGAAGATLAAPVAVHSGYFTHSANATSFTLPLAYLGVQDGDIVLVFTSPEAAATVSPASGYTSVQAAGGIALYTHKWSTGDSKTPAFTASGGGTHFVAVEVAIVRKTGTGGTGTFGIDTSGKATNSSVTPAACAVTAPSITPTGTNELLFVYFGDAGSSAGTWSAVTNTGLTDEEINSAGPSFRLSWKEAISAATSSSYAATMTHTGSGTTTVTAIVVLLGMAVTATSAFPVVFAAT